uniref:Non-specific serine/threonine protein kinase n=1 Tax=Haemonchus contortus TaxID=6289 RepID=A0A7I4YUS2_HAECO
MEKEAELVSFSGEHAERPERWERQQSSQSADSRSPKRVLINDEEAKSELTRKTSEQRFSELSTSSNIEDMLVDSDVITFVRDVLKNEFPDGSLNFDGSQDQPVETVFRKTLKFNGKHKTVYVHLRNHVSTATGDSVVKNIGSSSQSTSYSSPTSVTSPQSDRAGDSGAHTKASSWSGPHVPTPVPSVISTNTFHRSFSTSPKRDGPYKAESQKLNEPYTETFEGPAEILERKLTRKELLDRSELLALKRIHCDQVEEDEEELDRLSRSQRRGDLRRIQILRDRLIDRYRTYEEILEMARPSKSAILAHRILLADAYLFHARIEQTSQRCQRKLYQVAVEIYRGLLNLARECLPADDSSLLTLAERISSILSESRSLQPDLIVEITSILDNAEKCLNEKPETESRRKIRRARYNLGTLGAFYYAYL